MARPLSVPHPLQATKVTSQYIRQYLAMRRIVEGGRVRLTASEVSELNALYQTSLAPRGGLAPVMVWSKSRERFVPKARYVPETGTYEFEMAESSRVRSLGYTWRVSPLAGAKNGKVYRTVSVKSPANSWIYPPKTWVRHKASKRRDGTVHVRTSIHVTPPRDMKPSLLNGRPYRVIPVKLSPAMLAYMHSR